jgi:hypothetical protein
MRRVLFLVLLVGLLAWAAVGVAPAKSGKGMMCVLHARLTAKNETTGSTSTAKGHTLIKVREDGTITFKTQINNPTTRHSSRATSTRPSSASPARS